MTRARGGILVLGTLLAALAAIAACKDTVPASAVTDCDQQVVPAGARTDILFVVDDSGSMREEQQELAANLAQFIDALANAPVRLDVHIGVTNTSIDRGGDGATPGEYGTNTTYGTSSGGQPFPGPAGTPYPAGTIVAIHRDPDGATTAGNFEWNAATGTWGGSRILSSGAMSVAALSSTFKSNVLHGVWGSGKEQPLEAMRLALQAADGGVNAGFLRADARLAVVVLTDEDDCSSATNAVTSDADCHARPGALTPLDNYVSYLASTAAFNAAGPPVFAIIAGFDAENVATSFCRGWDPGFDPTTDTQAAWVPNRLETFRRRLESTAIGTQTLKRSICGSYGRALLDVASLIIPQTITIDPAPPDWHLLAVSLDRGGCNVALAGSSDAPTADAVYTPPAQEGGAATITFQNACVLGIDDRVNLSLICVR
jgi:hypothetical protein